MYGNGAYGLDVYGGDTLSDLPVGTYSNQVLADNPLGYWPLSTDAKDVSGNGRNGTLTGSPTFGSSGPSGEMAASGFTTGNYITLPSSAYVPGAFTLEAWVKATTSPWAFFLSLGSSSGMFGINGSTTALTYVAASGSNLDGPAISNGAWRHCVVTRDASGNLLMYIDGVQVKSFTGVNAPASVSPRIGVDTAGANPWPGSISRVAIYPAALPASRVTAHYQSGLPRYAREVLADQPVGYWRAVEPSGTSLIDDSGNGNTLTITGANWAREAGPTVDGDGGLYWVWDTGSYAKSTNQPAFEPSMTVESWVKMDTTPGAVATLIGNGALYSATGQTEFGLQVDTSGRPLLYGWTGASTVITGSAMSLGKWHHVVGTLTPTGLTLMVDNVVVATSSAAFGGAAARYLWLHGGYSSNGGNVHMAEPAVYNTALSKQRIASHYLVGASKYGREINAASPTAYFRLGEASGTTAYDASGNGRNGTYNGGAALGYASLLKGDPDRSVDFSGSGQYVDVPYNSWMEVLDYTLEAVVQPDNVTAAGTIIDRRGSAVSSFSDQAWSLRIYNSKFEIVTFIGTTLVNPIGATTLTAGKTYHVAAVKTGTNLRIYVNGYLDAAVTLSSATPNASTSPLSIGRTLGVQGGGEFFDGRIDEVSIHGIGLGPDVIARNAALALSTYATEVLKDAPLAYYRLGEGSGTVMRDSAGLTRDGSYVASPPSVTGLLPTDDLDTARQFNGTSQYGTVPSATWMNTSTITLEALIKPSSVASYPCIIDRDDEAQRYFQFRLVSGKLEFLWWDSSGTIRTVDGTTVLATGMTYHVAATHDGTTARLYVNGAFEASTVAGGVATTRGSNVLSISNHGSTGTSGLNGVIDEVAYYGTDIGAARIKAHYDAYANGPKVITVSQATSVNTANPITPTQPGGPDVVASQKVDGLGSFTVPTGVIATDLAIVISCANSGETPPTISGLTSIHSEAGSGYNGNSGTLEYGRGLVAGQVVTWDNRQATSILYLRNASDPTNIVAQSSADAPHGGSTRQDPEFVVDARTPPAFSVVATSATFGNVAMSYPSGYQEGPFGVSQGSTFYGHLAYSNNGVGGTVIVRPTDNAALNWEAWQVTVARAGGVNQVVETDIAQPITVIAPAAPVPTVNQSLETDVATAMFANNPIVIPMNNVVAQEFDTAGSFGRLYGMLTVPLGVAATASVAQRVIPLKAPDPFALPWVIAGGSGSLVLDMSDGTLETGEPNPNGVTRSSWLQWTAPDSGAPTRFHTRGSNVDSALAVFTGAAIDALTQVAVSDNAYGGAADLVFTPVAGSTYMIQLGTKTDPATAVSLTWFEANPAEYDSFATPLDLEADRGYEGFTTANGTVDAGESVPSGTVATSWLRWVATGPEPVTFTFRSADPDPFTVHAYNAGGGTLGSLMSVASATGTGEVAVTFAPADGQTYYLQVAVGNDLRDFEVGWGVEAAPVDPEELPEPPAPEYEPVDVGPVLPRVYLRVEIYGPGGQTLISEVKRRTGVQWQEPLNTPGSGQITMHLDDELLEAYPDLLDFGNIVKFWMGTHCVHGFIIRNRKVNWVDSGEWAGRTITVSGPSVHYMLEDFIVRHDGDPRPDSLGTRYYSWASKPGDWLNMADWDHSISSASMQDPPSNKKKKKPKNWKVQTARWIWFTGPNVHGHRYFRKTFRTQEDGTLVRLFASGDEYWEVYLDGEQVMSDNAIEIGYTRYKKYDTVLSRGQHTLALHSRSVDSGAKGDGNDAILFALCKVDLDGKIIRPALVVSDETWNAHGGNPPGWNRAQVLKNVITEAKDRKISSATRLTIGFTGDTDSRGKKWPRVMFNQEVSIGTSALNLQAQLSEGNGFDVWVDPEDMTVKAWIRRGVDKSASITLEPGRNLINWEVSESDEVKNKYYIQYDGGWVEHNAAGSQEDFDERELYISLGSVKHEQAAKDLIKRASMGIARAQQRAGTGVIHRRPMGAPDGGLVGVPGAYPFIDFKTGDTVKGPNSRGKMVPMRVLSLSGAEDGDGNLSFDPDLEEIKSV